MAITAKRALYIKLGEKNRWAQLSFETSTLRFGFRDFSHDDALAAVKASDFHAVKKHYEELGAEPGTATRYSNEIREFYTAGPDVLWITFADGRMWWCLPTPKWSQTQPAIHRRRGCGIARPSTDGATKIC